MNLTYKELQKELKILRDLQGIKLKCKLNQNKKILKAEYKRLTEKKSLYTNKKFKRCNLKNKLLNQILEDGSLIDNLHSSAFPPQGKKYSLKSVVTSLNAAGYQTTNDKDSVTIFNTEGWISVYSNKLFFNFDGTYDMKIAATLGSTKF